MSVTIERLRKLRQRVNDSIIKLRIVALELDESFDDAGALSVVFNENFRAKENIKRMQRLLDGLGEFPERHDLQEMIWKLDDERSLESRAAWLRIRRWKRSMLKKEWLPPRAKYKSSEVFVFANMDMVGNQFVYNVTIKSRSDSVVTDVSTTIVAFPRDCMTLSSDYVKKTPRLDVDGFVTESFVFTPTKDCVEGKIVAVVSFIDHKDQIHSVQLEPYIIRSVCDLLKPYESSTDEFEDTFETLVGGCQEITLGWNAAVVLEKAKTILPQMNFYLIDVQNEQVGDQIFGTVRGFALGKYTGKRVAVVMKVIGGACEGTCTVEVEVLGDDSAMLPTTIGEIAEKIDAWICLECGARLNPDQVMELEAGGVLSCRYCDHSLTLGLYTRSDKKPRPKFKEPSTTFSSDGVTTQVPADQARSTSTTTEMKEADAKIIEGVSVLRGCEVVGNKFDYKVKVKNDSESVITNVAVTIVAYPMDCMTIIGEPAKVLSRIEVGGFRSPGFSFVPTKDCVEGKILATVSFIDHKDQVHTLHAKPYIIKSVCDLLQPLETTPAEFEALLTGLECSEEEYEFDWKAELLFKKAGRLLASKNFYIVDCSEETEEGTYSAKIRGFAEGKYTQRKIAVEISITGPEEGEKAVVKIQSLGEDSSMIPTTIEELRDGFDTWVCPSCDARMGREAVVRIRSGQVVECPHCGHSLSMALYITRYH